MIAKLDLRDLVKLCSKSSTWSCLSLGDLRTIQGQHLYRQRPKLLLHTYAPIPYLRRRTALEFTRCTSSLSFFTFSLSLLRLRLFSSSPNQRPIEPIRSKQPSANQVNPAMRVTHLFRLSLPYLEPVHPRTHNYFSNFSTLFSPFFPVVRLSESY